MYIYVHSLVGRYAFVVVPGGVGNKQKTPTEMDVVMCHCYACMSVCTHCSKCVCTCTSASLQIWMVHGGVSLASVTVYQCSLTCM